MAKKDIIGYSGLFGTPIYTDLTFEKGSYINSQGDIIDYDELTLIHIIIVVSMNKNIVKTPVQGRNMTFKEYISDGDFSIDITGKLQNQTKEEMTSPPKELVRKLTNICKVQDALAVSCNYLQQFGISNLVIDSYNIPMSEGMINVQDFSLQCSSDQPVELLIK